MSHKPASALKTIPLVWPFAVWGLDMVGPLRTGRSGFTHVLVAVDKFTKWIEAKPIKNLDACTAISFVRGLTFRYGVPHSIITDNGSNFDSDKFRAFCASQGTRVDYASVAHPQSNGQAERANGLILKGLKPRLMRDLKHAAGAWVDELPSVLWGLRTTPNRSTGRTPFFLVYGAEAVLPSDLLHNAPRVELYTEDEAEQARQDAVDLLEEEREMAMIRSTIYQQDLRRFHARNVKSRAYQEGDLVLRVDQQKPHKLIRRPGHVRSGRTFRRRLPRPIRARHASRASPHFTAPPPGPLGPREAPAASFLAPPHAREPAAVLLVSGRPRHPALPPTIDAGRPQARRTGPAASRPAPRRPDLHQRPLLRPRASSSDRLLLVASSPATSSSKSGRLSSFSAHEQ
ncbi:uncharacterized protein LOC125546794 [Triticum urartu]|uniref:uncharacterized protein LOC125546794 n=1 Tax=Triticum urartu TaxID=4572 RepID=UPI0020447583|nr:uncharacterized protein LOC125546794 [Triticum urartu]